MPGDKSISHRALILAALAEGRSRIIRPNLGDDVRSTARALEQLGVRCEIASHKAQVEVEGGGWERLSEPDDVIDLGNSGTSMRVLLGLCAGIEGSVVLTGDSSLRRRPMLRVAAPLRQMGARVDGRRHGDLAPLTIRGGALSGVDVRLQVASAQVKTALLLAGLSAGGSTRVEEPTRSRDHTERMLRALGVDVRVDDSSVTVRGGSSPRTFDVVIPGDMSSAMFLVAAAAIVPGSDLTLVDVGVNPTRTAALGVLESMGAAISWGETSSSLGEPVGSIHVAQSPLRGIRVPPELVPSLIDDIPALAIVASQAEGETTFSGAAELRVKESDRITALVTNLKQLGVDAEELPDGLVVRGPGEIAGGEVDSFGDHRIALSFAVAGLIAGSRVRVKGWSCVDTSFPEFLDVLGEVTASR